MSARFVAGPTLVVTCAPFGNPERSVLSFTGAPRRLAARSL